MMLELNRSHFMMRTTLLCGMVLSVIPFLSPAKDFPLEFKTLTAEEAMAFPGGSGLYGQLRLEKPGDITKAPPAISKHPLYGQLSNGTNRLFFRLDESQGDGKGYDRLIVDMNQNGDLTDDLVATRVEQPHPASGVSRTEMALFGPIPVPEGKKIGAWRPIYFAQMYLFTPPAEAGTNTRNVFLGQLRFKAGWYLETTVELDGVTRKVGIVDGNCNFHLGNLNQPVTYPNGKETNWYFSGGDYFLVDNNGSGKFESSVGNSASAPFGPLLYLGAKPYKAVLAADDKSLALEPWTGPLAELALQPHGEQVSGISVAWEKAPEQWQLLQLGVENGKAKVPPGNYWLYTCTIKVKAAAGDTLILSGYKRTPTGTAKAEAGASMPFKCGSPLEIKVASERDTRNMDATAPESGSGLVRLFRGSTRAEKPLQQLIQASVIGVGGEQYSSFFLKETKGNLRQPPKPTFVITTTDGKEVASGNLEFG
jgi:hypothetical protein